MFDQEYFEICTLLRDEKEISEEIKERLLAAILEIKKTYACFEEDCDRGAKSLIYLSQKLSEKGYRYLNESSCKAAIKAIEHLTEQLETLTQVTYCPRCSSVIQKIIVDRICLNCGYTCCDC